MNHPMNDATTGLEALLARVEGDARAAYIAHAQRRRWSLWMRLTWAVPVSEHKAMAQVEAWARRLRKRLPGAAVMVGLHSDTDRRHAHALVYLPTTGNPPPNPSGVWLRGLATAWHTSIWGRGHVWLDRFQPGRFQSSKYTATRGAARYLARDVGTVTMLGSPPEYRSRRKR
jgi:hypothetical protein